MRKGTLFVLLLFVVFAPSCMSRQNSRFATEAGIDSDGNIYVSSDSGKQIIMATAQHCIEAHSADDRQTIGCSVARGTRPEEATQSTRLEIFLKNGRRQAIETQTPMDWHFWEEGRQVSVHSRTGKGDDRYALYDAATAKLVAEVVGPVEESELPQWAKNSLQVNDESVPVGDEYDRERAKWISKVLRQITKIRPAMTRQDLLKFFSTEGGLSTRFQRTYVYTECPYIKVNVRFKPAGNDGSGAEERPDDIIESISQPYLAWSVMD